LLRVILHLVPLRGRLLMGVSLFFFPKKGIPTAYDNVVSRRNGTQEAAMSEQQPLFFEDVNDALRHAVQACGGAKVVGGRLWPDRSADAAARQLHDCINPDRPAHLTPEQLMMVFRLARERGEHAPLRWFCGSVGYSSPSPLTIEDERAATQRDFVNAVALVAGLADRMVALGVPIRPVQPVVSTSPHMARAA
jgi:hypothetical protein